METNTAENTRDASRRIRSKSATPLVRVRSAPDLAFPTTDLVPEVQDPHPAAAWRRIRPLDAAVPQWEERRSGSVINLARMTPSDRANAKELDERAQYVNNSPEFARAHSMVSYPLDDHNLPAKIKHDTMDEEGKRWAWVKVELISSPMLVFSIRVYNHWALRFTFYGSDDYSYSVICELDISTGFRITSICADFKPEYHSLYTVEHTFDTINNDEVQSLNRTKLFRLIKYHPMNGQRYFIVSNNCQKYVTYLLEVLNIPHDNLTLNGKKRRVPKGRKHTELLDKHTVLIFSFMERLTTVFLVLLLSFIALVLVAWRVFI